MKLEKNKIAGIFSALRKYGFDVFVFSDNKPLRKGMRGFVDILIVSRKYVVFIEVKSEQTKDKLNEEQIKLGEKISALSTFNKAIHYYVIRNQKEANRIFELILKGEL